MVNHDNFLLNRVDPAALARIAPYMNVLQLEQGKILAETHRPVLKVYFPHAGIISNVVELISGEAIETAMIGSDGAFGASQAMDGRLSLNHVVMQVPGVASTIDSGRLCELALQIPPLRKLLVAYEQFFVAQVQQAAACNAVHDIHNRMCRWLLRMQRLVGDDLPLTQEFLAQMMGVQRTSVSTIAGSLQKLGMITYGRGHIHINDLELVRQHACECDETIQSHYRRLFPAARSDLLCPELS
jgi:CRP-like cAMP-binding protein